MYMATYVSRVRMDRMGGGMIFFATVLMAVTNPTHRLVPSEQFKLKHFLAMMGLVRSSPLELEMESWTVRTEAMRFKEEQFCMKGALRWALTTKLW
jgi:hypothetical protein